VATVLIIDDDELMRTFLVESFEEKGYDVRAAKNGRLGIDAYIEQPTDLVITDLFMPEKDGVEVARSLIKHDPEVKIIAMSGGDSAGGRKDVLEVLEDFGVKRTFGKPFKIAEVLEAAGTLIGENE
jgi:two-component system, chemotaxis family, chemotaxis protein CheY